MSQEDILRAIIFSQKVRSSSLPSNRLVLMERVIEPIYVHNHLGRLGHAHPRLRCLSLHPSVSHPHISKDLLLGPRSESSLLHEYRARRLPHLPPHLISLGSGDRRNRLLRPREASGPLHWDRQPASRCHHCGAADAGSLGFEDGHGEESQVERHVRLRYRVCSLRQLPTPIPQTYTDSNPPAVSAPSPSTASTTPPQSPPPTSKTPTPSSPCSRPSKPTSASSTPASPSSNPSSTRCAAPRRPPPAAASARSFSRAPSPSSCA